MSVIWYAHCWISSWSRRENGIYYRDVPPVWTHWQPQPPTTGHPSTIVLSTLPFLSFFLLSRTVREDYVSGWLERVNGWAENTEL